MQAYSELDLYEQYLVNNLTYDEKINRLLATAEKCMKEKRYFFITFRGTTFAHALCGIGVTDGNWTFNDKSYDKCVLVLDSNAKNKDKEPIGFTNEICIYINSETKESYIPFYDRFFTGDEEISFVAIDDNSLLNNKGAINPSEKIDTDLSKIKKFLYTDDDKKDMKIYSIIQNPSDNLNIDRYIKENMEDKTCFEADTIRFELENAKNTPRNYRYIDTERWIDLELKIKEEDTNGEKVKFNCDFEISDDKIFMNNNNKVPLTVNTLIRMNDDSYNFAPYYDWMIAGKVANKLSIEIRDKGMLIKSDGLNDILISPYYYSIDDKGKVKELRVQALDNYNYLYLSSSNNVLINIDEEKNFVYYIDDNGDDVYDTRVQKGDINCDGFIDAVDASKVLSIYARLSTIINNPVDCSLGDINNDGFVDAVDASAILAKYAELSTT